jgi:hypothetical protein
VPVLPLGFVLQRMPTAISSELLGVLLRNGLQNGMHLLPKLHTLLMLATFCLFAFSAERENNYHWKAVYIVFAPVCSRVLNL